jgi:hypothetical protein
VAKVDGETVKVGDYVCFKSDVEQCGKIYLIKGDRLYLQAGSSGFQGDYIVARKQQFNCLASAG